MKGGRFLLLSLSVVLVAGCTMSAAGPDTMDKDVSDSGAGGMEDETARVETVIFPELIEETGRDGVYDTSTDGGSDWHGPQCNPGEGCFLDKCAENSDCQSSWCVEHMGEKVCSQSCFEECPPGWSCQQVSDGGPDLVFVCVSKSANLCRPCVAASDCKGTAGTEDTCVDYGEEGSFCGGKCAETGDCPWGFACEKVFNVDGIELKQCIAETGICPCTENSVALGLWTPCTTTNDWGTCTGKRVCTEEGLTECDAAAPAAEYCNDLDDDCDGDVDEADFVEGDYLNVCDDGNDCTDDTCQGETGCQHENLSQGECVDGDSCTVGDHCDEGICVGSPVQCNDDNPCTDDTCDGLGGCTFADNQDACDDQDPCSVGDHCSGGSCSGIQVPCDCQSDEDCAQLEDGDPCNGTLLCDTEQLPYKCDVAPASLIVCPPPEGPEAACQQSACAPDTGDCSIVPANDGFACDDSNACTVGDHCDDGACDPGVSVNCADNNPCTDDLCDVELGCLHTDNLATCSDGNPCTVGDQCSAGECVPGEPMVCEDQNPCTTDSCDPLLGCHHAPVAAACDDGNECTTGDHCSDGQCLYDAVAPCNDDNVCTTDSCDPKSGCLHVLNEAPCDDGDVCTLSDHCHLGQCINSGMLNCNDSNPCTDDACTPGAGCAHTPNAALCDDGNECTSVDACADGSCAGGQPLDCDDSNPCTADLCDPATGCVNQPLEIVCDDDNPCTADDQCQAGTCEGTPVVCDDNNPCTDDSCKQPGGCEYVPNEEECPGGNCVAGVCVPDCVPNCFGKECGTDGCSGSCGDCAEVPNTGCGPAFTCEFIPCVSDAQCAQHGMVCNAGEGHCVECMQDAECVFLFDNERPYCSPEYNLCGECLADGDCPPEKLCNLGLVPGECHAPGSFEEGEPCSADDQCLPGLVCEDNNICSSLCGKNCKPEFCDPDLGLCVTCLLAGDCGESQVCAGGDCVPGQACDGPGDCDGNEPVCADELCVECAVDQDCPPEHKCGADNTCHKECNTSLVCDGLVCDQNKGVCVECAGDGDCLAQNKPKCDLVTGICVQCTSSGHCAADHYCQAGVCLPDECEAGVESFCVAKQIRVCNDEGSAFLAPVCGESCCPENEYCINGACLEIICDPGKSVCEGACVDLQTDKNHCGECEISCADDEECIQGECKGTGCQEHTGNLSIGGPAELYGFCWYLTQPGGNCDATCAELGGANLVPQAENAWPNNCDVAGPDDLSTWFYQHGNPGQWNGNTGGTNGHSMGYGYTNSSYYGKCTSGTSMNIGAYPGASNDSPTRATVCPCFVD